MKINYYTTTKTNYFTDSMKEIAERKFSSLEKYLKEDEPLKITLNTTKNGSIELKAQAVLKDNYHLHLEAGRSQFNSAIAYLAGRMKDEARDHLKRYKKHVEENNYDAPLIHHDDPLFAKYKVYVLDSISDEEAIKQLEETGHDFYIYKDDHGNTCIAYKRMDGAYGKISTR